MVRYEHLTLRAGTVREELHTEVERLLNDVIRFKVHVQKSLEDYEQFVADEAEQECAELEKMAAAAALTTDDDGPESEENGRTEEAGLEDLD